MASGKYGQWSAAMLAALVVAAWPGGAAHAAENEIRIMPLGDSIVRGTGAPGLDSFRTLLHDHLALDGLPVDFVGSQSSGTGPDRDHEGHRGYDLGELADLVEGWLNAYQPDVILLYAGTNNVTRGDDPQRMLAELGTMLDRIHATSPGAAVFLAQLALSRDPKEAEADRLYNALLPGFVAGRADNRLVLVDQSSVAGIDLHDLHHPNAFGYEKMAWNWYRSLARELELPGGSGPDPYKKTKTYRCLVLETHGTECRTWVLRDQPDGSREWQTLRRATVVIDGVPRTVEYWAGPGDLSKV